MMAMGGLVQFMLFLMCSFSLSHSIVYATYVTQNGTIILEDGTEIEFNFDPQEINGLETGEERRVYFNVTLTVLSGNDGQNENSWESERSDINDIFIHVESADPDEAVISDLEDFRLVEIINQNSDLQYEENSTTHQNDSLCFTVRGEFLGYAEILFYINGSVTFEGNISISSDISSSNNHYENGQSLSGFRPLPLSYKVAVIRKERIVDHIFVVAVAILVFFSNMGMGCKVDLKVVKEILKKPISPTIGFCCQYIIMPLVSFGALTMMGLEGGLALGLFAAGCAPGGSGSNMYTFLLDGDVSLSVTMTLISTLSSLFMIPLWLYTLGRLIMGDDSQLQIPVSNILISLFCLLVPVGVGVIIRWKKPRAAQFFIKCLKPFFLVLIIFMFTFGIWTNLYIFHLITATLCIAGAFLPYVGFVLGGLVALACRQPWARVVTIAIETGLQNTGIPIILLKFSLPQPEADMSIASPVTMSMFTPIPLFTAVIIYEIRKRCCKKASDQVENENEPNNVKMKLTNGEAVSDPEASEDDLLTPEDAKLNGKPSKNGNNPKLVFSFDESNRTNKSKV